TNQDVQSASITRTKDDAAPMTVESSNPREIVGSFRVTTSQRYTIKFRTPNGQVNPEPVVYDIVALKDHAPTATFEKPEKARIQVPSNGKVALVMKATDDHGVKDVTLHVQERHEQLPETLLSKNLLEKRPVTREFRGTEMLDLAAWKVKPGAVLEYWMTVRD